ncbi:hypothetical protein Glove_610g14 [Diversispora epigaea]|uniref:RNase H type-1 domain-containing protein n=1 Tax=Diversispora epigaea TaxID=1348612 RepID=A0A397GB58_9GLOM|nr:hypothetical protein Glove_610g14 [Diversispora epigaea]
MNPTTSKHPLGSRTDLQQKHYITGTFPRVPYGGLHNIKNFIGNELWYDRNRSSLRKRGVIFLEQLLNPDLSQAIPWQQIGGMPTTGKQPKWYQKELYPTGTLNPFNIMHKIEYGNLQRFQMVVAKKGTNLIFETISRNSKPETMPQIVIQHYQQEIINSIERSRSSHCLIKIDNNTIKHVPTKKRIGSTTQKSDRRPKRHLLISPKSMEIYYDKPTNINPKIAEDLKGRATDDNLNQKEKTKDAIMRLGLLLIPEDNSENVFEFFAKISSPVSSTRPELWAILMALELAPINAKLKIHTDSASTIAAIKSYMLDRWEKKHILQAISDKCNGKQIIFELIKVSAHSGNVLNDRADNLVKKGAAEGSLLNINYFFYKEKLISHGITNA